MRVLIFSHGHPLFSKGGGEFAAYYLYQGLNAVEEHEAWFVGCAENKMLHWGMPIAALNEREYLIEGQAGIPNLTTGLAVDEGSDFAHLIKTIQPDVVHFHHYVSLGLELIRAVRNLCPDVRIVLTLHEYIAICMNNGQMVKTDGRLCYQYSPRECSECFPEQTVESFFLRERYIKTFFDIIDTFVSPSYFLRDRYIAWGIDENRINVIENGIPPGQPLEARVLQNNQKRGRFAYFGQFTPYKGIDIIIEAFASLPKSIKEQVTLDLYGSGLEKQSTKYQHKINSLLKKNKQMIRYHGAYETIEQSRLMSDIDWVVMGSIWWENSPLVIQEAFKYGRPVICPDIGGMAEKIQDGVNGLHYRARDMVSLASVITRVIDDNAGYETLCSQLPAAATIAELVEAHTRLYKKIPD